MPEKKLERRPILDPAVAGLLDDMEHHKADSALPRREREKKARERAKIRARREQRATFDLPPALRQRIMDLAESERLPASQLVTLALARFLLDHTAGEVDLAALKQPSRSPRYDWNLVLPDELAPWNEEKPVKKAKKRE